MSKKVEQHVLNEYRLIREMGSGAYGHVWEVQQKKSKKKYALKKVFDAFRNSIDAQRTYREVEVLKQLKSNNIVKMYRVMKSKNKKDLYLIFQFMEADLHSVVGSNILQKMHQVFVFYQILKGLKYLHSSELIHRDLKPSNILLNSQCHAKLCDFGLVRSLSCQQSQQAILSEEVATKWYRAPQLLLGSRSYGKPIDVWSFGCIVAQILTGKPMFAGDSTLNQLQKIVQYTGTVSQQDIDSLDSPVAEQLITQIKVKKKSFREYFSSVDPDYWELLKGTLEFNPHKRMTIDQVLQLELFDEFRSEIQGLKYKQQAIKPKIDDNIRLGLKVYRQRIYDQIDAKQSMLSLPNKKLNDVQNLVIRKNSIGKKRAVSQQKSLLSKNNNNQNTKIFNKFQTKQNNFLKSKVFSKQKSNKKYHSTKSLPSYYSNKSPYVTALLKKNQFGSQHKNNNKSCLSPFNRKKSKYSVQEQNKNSEKMTKVMFKKKKDSKKLIKKTNPNMQFSSKNMLLKQKIQQK